MAKFSAKKYKQRLQSSVTIEDCEKVPVPRLKQDQRYIFISYSHRDYKKVFQDLADLYESGIPFWYDRGLPAGENWDDLVRRKMSDPRCSGVIFYLSDSLFISQSFQTELNIVFGEDDHPAAPDYRLPYFTVNLTEQLPSSIVLSAFSTQARFTDTYALQQWITTLAQAFPDEATYLPFSSRTHKRELVEQISIIFNIYAFDYGSTSTFSAKAFKKELETTSNIEQIAQKLFLEPKKNQNYIFISYSHQDYKQVYQDLADLREKGIPFWFDAGLPAGDNWDDVVRQKMRNSRCRGVIFYLSDNLFLSPSVQKEIKILYGKDSTSNAPDYQLTYFSVNLTLDKPLDILRRTTRSKTFIGVDDESAATGEWFITLCTTFPNKTTYLPFSRTDHKNNLLNQINEKFGIRENDDSYDFSIDSRFDTREGVNLIRGNGIIRYDDGSWYDGEIRNNLRHGQGVYTLADGTVQRGTFRDDAFVDA